MVVGRYKKSGAGKVVDDRNFIDRKVKANGLLSILRDHSACIWLPILISQHGMAKPSDNRNDNSVPLEPMAIELGNLRNHFSTASLFGTGNPAGMDCNAAGDTLVDRRSPLALDSAFVQQTKDQIRAVVENIASLAHTPISPQDFVQAVLPKIASAMGALGAGLWQQYSDSAWQLLGEFHLPSILVDGVTTDNPDQQSRATPFEQLDFIESQLNAAIQATPSTDGGLDMQIGTQPSASHLLVLNAVARERQPILIPPSDALLNCDRPANPTAELLIYAPLPIPKDQGSYWLQIVQSPSGGPSSQRGYLRFVAQMADLMSDYFRSHRLRVFERDREYLTLAERTMRELACGLAPKLGVAKLMKTIREHARAEHAFLLRRESYFGRWRVVGAAGLVEIDRRADGIGQIERASSGLHAMFRRGGSLSSSQLPGGVDDRDPDLTSVFNTFAISELQWIKPLEAEAGATRQSKQKLDVAVLLTWSGMDKPPTRCPEQIALISKLGLSALQITWWKSALFASHSTKRNPFAIANPASWPRTAKWVVAMLLVSLVFALPVPIRLHATAILVPLVQQHVYAPMDATVDAVLVEHGQSVKQGDPLIRLKSLSLSLEYEQAVAQQSRNRQRLADIGAMLLRETTLSSLQRIELEGERKSIESNRTIEWNQLALLQKQMDSLLVVASVDGVVSTWNVQDSLRDRPLRTGQWLLSLHESDSPWILEAALPERDAQEFRLAIEDDQNPPVATMTSMPQIQLPVHLLRGSQPRIDSSQPAEAFTGPNSAVLRMRFELDAASLPAQIAVAGATARISIPIGRGPLIWALGKDFANKVWSRVQLWI